MPYSIDRLNLSPRVIFRHDFICQKQRDLHAHRERQTGIWAQRADTVGLVALGGQARLCDSDSFRRLDAFCASFSMPNHDISSNSLGSEALCGAEANIVSALSGSALLIGSTLVYAVQAAISGAYIVVTAAAVVVDAARRVIWPGASFGLPLGFGLMAPVTMQQPADQALVPQAPSAQPARQAARPSGRQRAAARRAAAATADSIRRFGGAMPPFYAELLARVANNVRLAPPPSSGRALVMNVPTPVVAAQGRQLAVLAPAVRFTWPQLVGAAAPAPSANHFAPHTSYSLVYHPSSAPLGLRAHGHAAPMVFWLDLQDLQQLCATFISAQQTRGGPGAEAVGAALAARGASSTRTAPSLLCRSRILEFAPFVETQYLTPRGRIMASRTSRQAFIMAGSGYDALLTLISAWNCLGSEQKRRLATAQEPLLWFRRTSQLGLASAQPIESPALPRFVEVEDEVLAPSAAETDDDYVSILAPTPPAVRTSSGPRLPDEKLEVFLQRLRADGGARSLYEGGDAAFVSRVRELHAKNQERERKTASQPEALLGLHPQFIKDLPRSSYYVYPQGKHTAPAAAFEVYESLKGHWDETRSLNENIAKCTPLLSSWLDVVLPRTRGLLREDVTFEATQAGLAAACEAVQCNAQPGHVVTPMQQKSTEFVVWPDNDDGRVHIVGLVQYGSMMVMSLSGDHESMHTPLYPYRMHVHLSVGERPERTTPPDVVIHEGSWSNVAPW